MKIEKSGKKSCEGKLKNIQIVHFFIKDHISEWKYWTDTISNRKDDRWLLYQIIKGVAIYKMRDARRGVFCK